VVNASSTNNKEFGVLSHIMLEEFAILVVWFCQSRPCSFDECIEWGRASNILLTLDHGYISHKNEPYHIIE